MNYYEHHIGDYAQATAHLSFLEDAAYSRLIRKYYADERPLPTDIYAAQRLVGARSREEKISVETVLKEFFYLADDGWHNKRADIEIARYLEKSSKAAASARARWDKQPCERNANAMRTHNERNAGAMQTQCSPDTIHQTPDKAPVHQQADVDGFDSFWKLYPRKEAKALAVKAWKKAKVNGEVASVLASLAKQKNNWTDPKFIPHAATWLNGRRWEDEPTAEQKEARDWI